MLDLNSLASKYNAMLQILKNLDRMSCGLDLQFVLFEYGDAAGYQFLKGGAIKLVTRDRT